MLQKVRYRPGFKVSPTMKGKKITSIRFRFRAVLNIREPMNGESRLQNVLFDKL